MSRWLMVLSCLLALSLFAQRPPDITLSAETNRKAIDGVLADRLINLLRDRRGHVVLVDRAIVVGESTRGGTHPGMMIKVHEHFGVFVPMDKPVYPIGTPKFVLGRPFCEKWEADDEGRPVKPDIEAPAEQALKVAHLEALQKNLGKHPEQKDDLEPLIEKLKKELNR